MAVWCNYLFIFLVVIGTGSSCDCDGPDTDNAQTCESLFRVFEDALLSDGGNIYKLRNLLYPSISAPPELANITYHLQFTNTTGGSAEIPNCFCPNENASNRTLLNTSGIITLRYGWTIIGIYTIVDPALLNQLQIQLPFAIMRLALPDGIPFLWNGYNQLPSTSLHLTISTDNLNCLPGHSEVDGVLKRLTSYLKRYAQSGRAVGGGRGDLAGVHYVLDGQSVSNVGGIPTDSCASFMESSITATIVAILYVAIVVLGLIVNSADKFFKGVFVVDHQSVPFVIGFLICTSLFGVAVTLAEMICFPWNCFLSSIVSYKVVLPLFFLFPLLILIVIVRTFFRHTCSSLLKGFEKGFILIFALLSTLTLIWVFICFIPTLLLGFAYPLYFFSLVVVHVAFVYAVTVALAAVLGEIIFMWNVHKANRRTMMVVAICLFVYIAIGSSFGYYGIMTGYGLTVVQGFVSTDGVNATVSLIPALPLFLIGWLIKLRFFADTENYDELVRKVVYKLTAVSSLSTPDSRMNLGKELGIPVSKLESIQLEVSRTSNIVRRKEKALGRMMSYWFKEDKEASLDKLADILPNLDPQGTCASEIRYLAASLRGGSRRESEEQGEAQSLLSETYSPIQYS